MACDEALLEAVGQGLAPPTVRFFAWSPPAISLGRNQPAPEAAALRALAARGVDVVRRPTGGRAVWHGPHSEELTYSVVAPLGEPPLDAGLVETYRRIHAALADGLRALGADAALAPRSRPTPRPGSRLACFAASVPHEITVDGAKLVGSAQRRTRRAVLQHGSIPLAGRQSVLRETWPECLDPGASTTLSAAAGRRIGHQEAAAALAAALGEGLNVRLADGVWGERENAAVTGLTGLGGPLDTRASAGRYSLFPSNRP